MDDKKLIEKKKPEEVIRAEKLIDDAKLDEALILLNNFEQKEGLSHYEINSCHLLQCQMLFWQGKLEELIKHAEQLYKESDGLENSFLKVDSLLLMTHAFTRFGKFDEASDLIKQGEELINKIPQELTKAYKQREAYLAFLKGYFINRRSDQKNVDLATKHLEHSLALREELGIKHEIAETLGQMAFNLYFFKGEQNRALKYAKRSLTLAKESSKKYFIAFSLNILALIYSFQGELDRSIRFYEQCLALFKEFSNKDRLAGTLNNLSYSYKRRGELSPALESIEQSMALNLGLGRLRELALNHDYLIQILIDKGDLARAQQSLNDLKQLNLQLKDKQINLMYLLDKALVLKTSPRTIKRGKAEQILKHLLENKDLDYEGNLTVLLNLCDLLLTELRYTNELEVLDELKHYITQLLESAEKSQSYWVLCETCLIEAKISLLTFNIRKSQRFLTQAHQIAERFDFTQLTVKIANEKEELLKKLDLWEKLKEEGASMSDRMELARLDENIVKMIQKHPILTAQVSEEKIAISKERKICLVCRGEVLRFSYICECGAIYCGNCAQALTDLENVCWACDVPIDYLKPSKPYKEEERVKIGDSSKKK